MPITTKDFRDIGFTDAEARMYFFILYNPGLSTSMIAKKLGLSVGRVSTISKPLVESKVIIAFFKGKSTHYSVGDYEYLVDFVTMRNATLDQKVRDIQEEKNKNLKISKSIVSRLNEEFSDPNKVKIEIFETEEEMEDFRKQLLEESPTDLIQITNPDIREYSPQKIKQKTSLREDRNVKGIILYTTKTKDVKFLQKSIYLPYSEFKDIHGNIAIYNGTVILSLFDDPEKPKRIVIRSKSLYGTMKAVLDYIKNKNS